MGCTGPCNQGRDDCAHPDECDFDRFETREEITQVDLVVDILIMLAIVCTVMALAVLLVSAK